MSTRGWIHRGAGGKNSMRGSWRQRGQMAGASNIAGTVNESAMDPVAGEGEPANSGNRKFNSQVRLTHFLSLPLGSHDALCSRVQAFTDALLLSDPPITGLDKSIIVQPSRLHITLGVMALKDDSIEAPKKSRPQASGSTLLNESEPQEDIPPKTISDALTLLHSLKERIAEELKLGSNEASESMTLTVPLDTMGVLRTDKKQTAHVLWIGPKKTNEPTALDRVSGLVNEAFREHGFITEERPLKLHCTILNTKYRKGAGRKRSIPFSTDAIFASDAYRGLMHAPGQSTSATPPKVSSHDRAIECGSWAVGEIQLCQMAGRDPVTGAYVSVGGLNLS